MMNRLHAEVEAFVKYISPSPIEDEVRGLVVALVQKAVSQSFPDATVLPFGSFETKLYLPTGSVYNVLTLRSALIPFSQRYRPRH